VADYGRLDRPWTAPAGPKGEPSSARRVRGPICAHDSPHPCGSPFGPPAAFKSAVHADL